MGMAWPILIYVWFTFFIAISAVYNAGWAAGFYAFATSLIFIVVGASVKASVWWGDRAQKIGSPIVALLPLALAQWLSSGFSAQMFGYHLTGSLWGWIGFAICFVFTNKRLAS